MIPRDPEKVPASDLFQCCVFEAGGRLSELQKNHNLSGNSTLPIGKSCRSRSTPGTGKRRVFIE
jgi:hypothetical protein